MICLGEHETRGGCKWSEGITRRSRDGMCEMLAPAHRGRCDGSRERKLFLVEEDNWFEVERRGKRGGVKGLQSHFAVTWGWGWRGRRDDFENGLSGWTPFH